MKKIMCCMILGLCFACSSSLSLGTIAEETFRLERFSEIIDDKITCKEWNMGTMQDALPTDMSDDIYGIDPMLYEEVLIRRSLIEAECEEIVVFHVKEENQDRIVEQLKEYQNRRMLEYAILPNQRTCVENAQILKIGNYVFYVCSQDEINVIQYISSLA